MNAAWKDGRFEELYDMLVRPLHEELYRRQTFDFLDDLTWGQQLLLTGDYLHMQVGQGGFIQFIQNGYIGLLPDIISQLYKLGAPEMAQILDDVLKVYVLNREQLDATTSVEEFAKLYDEFREFEVLEERYKSMTEATIQLLLKYAVEHPDEFVKPAPAV